MNNLYVGRHVKYDDLEKELVTLYTSTETSEVQYQAKKIRNFELKPPDLACRTSELTSMARRYVETTLASDAAASMNLDTETLVQLRGPEQPERETQRERQQREEEGDNKSRNRTN